jgi:hypothetical protein
MTREHRVCPKNPGPWTEDEDAILIENYPELGLRVCAELIPGRSRGAVSIRASILGLKSPLTDHSHGGRRKGGNGSEAYKEATVFCLALRPKFLNGLSAFSDEANKASNDAFVAAMREHHPHLEVW